MTANMSEIIRGTLSEKPGTGGFWQYELSEDELHTAAAIANERNADKESAGIKSKKIAKDRSDLEVHMENAKARIAVARSLGIEEITHTVRKNGRCGEPDFFLPNGLSVEVHYRDRAGWDYALSSCDYKDFKADVGVLVWPGDNNKSVTIVGWISKIALLDRAEVKDYNYGPRLAVPASKMQRMKKLFEICMRR